VTSHREAVIEFYGEPPTGLAALAEDHPDAVTLIRAKGLGAAEFTVQALVVTFPIVTRQIVAIVKAHLEARRSIVIKMDGKEFHGLTPDEVMRLLDGSGKGKDAR
jgi:hypothetical protein